MLICLSPFQIFNTNQKAQNNINSAGNPSTVIHCFAYIPVCVTIYPRMILGQCYHILHGFKKKIKHLTNLM